MPNDSPLFDLSGKVALITGGGSGLGYAMARGLAEAGATVILNGRSRDKLEQASAVFRDAGLRAGIAPFDVTDSARSTTAWPRVLAEHGAIDILINNAGMQHRQPIENFTDDEWLTSHQHQRQLRRSSWRAP